VVVLTRQESPLIFSPSFFWDTDAVSNHLTGTQTQAPALARRAQQMLARYRLAADAIEKWQRSAVPAPQAEQEQSITDEARVPRRWTIEELLAAHFPGARVSFDAGQK